MVRFKNDSRLLIIDFQNNPFFSFLHVTAVSYDDEQAIEEDNPNWHPYLELASINKTRLRPCHKEYLLYTYGKKYYSELFTKGYHPGILRDCDGQGHSGYEIYSC